MISINNSILETIADLKPDTLLDVGCGCGTLTAKIAPHCGRVTAVDISPALIERCQTEHAAENITFKVMSATALSFPDSCFDTVIERASLHHMKEWQAALTEMIRVSSKYILVEEPINDPRSDAKRLTRAAEDLYLEVQAEAKFSHFPFLEPHVVTGFFDNSKLPYESLIVRSDREVGFDDFFDQFERFANMTERRDYWMSCLDRFLADHSGATLCESDRLIIVAAIS